MGGVVVELRSLVRPERILDGELVQPELVGELVELLLGRAAEVDPHHRVRPSRCSDTSATGKSSASRTPLR